GVCPARGQADHQCHYEIETIVITVAKHMREIVFDTETTGFDPGEGHRVVEVGCVELVNLIPSGRTFHVYINPERDVPEGAFAVHGLSEAFLAEHPVFAAHVADFLDFIGDAVLVAHNAEFDMRFINAELRQLGFPTIDNRRVVDTLAMARQRFPGSPATLDALCKRFGIDNSARTKHGALLDSELLAEVYLELKGGRQVGLALADSQKTGAAQRQSSRIARAPRPHAPTLEELAAHEAFLDREVTDPLWRK
ncbi:MAG: DNA polymerase III subunit epsilon, partial [Sphingomonadales bacterium]